MARVPSAKFVAVAKLPASRVVFHKRSDDGSGKANVVRAVGSDVYGVLYEFDDPDLGALRKAEGYPKHYEEKERVTVVTLEGEREVMTYFAERSLTRHRCHMIGM